MDGRSSADTESGSDVTGQGCPDDSDSDISDGGSGGGDTPPREAQQAELLEEVTEAQVERSTTCGQRARG